METTRAKDVIEELVERLLRDLCDIGLNMTCPEDRQHWTYFSPSSDSYLLSSQKRTKGQGRKEADIDSVEGGLG